MGTKTKGLAERPGLYILAGDGEVKGENRQTFKLTNAAIHKRLFNKNS